MSSLAYLIDEKKLVNDNIFLHEERLGSQYTRFLDRSPTFVKYYSINNIESTADTGFQNIERLLGPNSPLKFKEIKDLPIYGIDQIVLSLQDEEQGLDTSFDGGEGILLPNTIKPLPNDFFTINYLDKYYLFIVTEVAYDTIKSNNFYKITFSLKSVEEENVEHIEAQAEEKFSCIFTNIGTKDKCLVKDDDISLLKTLNGIYTNIAERYKMLYLDNKFNTFIFIDESKTPEFLAQRYYDRYQTFFINKYRLFNEKNNYSTFLLTLERTDHRFTLTYHDSIYRALELGNVSHVRKQLYNAGPIDDATSIFNIYREYRTKDVVLSSNNGSDYYIDGDLIDKILSNTYNDSDSVVWQTIIKFFNKDITTIYTLDIESLEDYNSYISYDFESYVLIPILMYVLKTQYNKFMRMD